MKDDIRHISYIMTNTADALKRVNETHQPIIITENGKAKAVLLDSGTYQSIINSKEISKIVSQSENNRTSSPGSVLKFPTAYYLIAASLSLVSYFFMYILFLFLLNKGQVYERWAVHFPIILCLMISVSIISFWRVCIGKSAIVPFIINTGLHVLAGWPFGSYVWIELVNMIRILIEASVLLSFPLGMICAGVAIAVTAGVQPETTVWFEHAEAVSFHDRMVVLFVGIVHMVFVFALRQLMIRFKRDCHAITDLQKSVSSLVEANVAGQRYAATIEDESVEAERNRITREIHDSLGYTLTNIVMLMEAAKDLAETDRDRLDEFLDFARGQALDGLAETRRTLREYRAIAQPELNIITAVNRLVRMVNATTSVAVKVDYSNILWTFGNTIDEVLYRVVQEGLTNAIRHGNATRVDVLFWCDAQRIHLTVRDNGRGGANIIDGIGLSGMRERLRGLGGELTTNSSPKGFRLAVEIPDYRNYQ